MSNDANTGKNSKADRGEDTMKLMVCDVSRAYFYAPAIRRVYVRMAKDDWEDGGEPRCGRFSVSMYGARDAALNWHEHYKTYLIDIGFAQG